MQLASFEPCHQGPRAENFALRSFARGDSRGPLWSFNRNTCSEGVVTAFPSLGVGNLGPGAGILALGSDPPPGAGNPALGPYTWLYFGEELYIF